MTRLSEEYSAAAGGKNLFTQSQMIIWREAPKKDFLHKHPLPSLLFQAPM
jgi:hypothetical protein